MEKSAVDLTVRMINLKMGMTKTEVKDIYVNFVLKLRGLNVEKIFYTKLPLNEDDNNFDEKLNDINCKRTIRKLHDDGCKKSYFTSADVSMLGYVCGMSQYHQSYDKELDRYQVLANLYRGSYDGLPGCKFVK